MGPRGMRQWGSAEDYETRAFMRSILTTYYLGDQIKKNEMGRACGTYGRQKRFVEGFWGEM